MLTLRLDPETEAILNTFSQRKGMSKSAVIREALLLYLNKDKLNQTPYELGADLFGKVSGSYKDEDASTTYKTRLKEKLHGKHSN